MSVPEGRDEGSWGGKRKSSSKESKLHEISYIYRWPLPPGYQSVWVRNELRTSLYGNTVPVMERTNISLQDIKLTNIV